MFDFTKMLAGNQKGMLNLIAPGNKQSDVQQSVEDYDSESENVFPTTINTDNIQSDFP